MGGLKPRTHHINQTTQFLQRVGFSRSDRCPQCYRCSTEKRYRHRRCRPYTARWSPTADGGAFTDSQASAIVINAGLYRRRTSACGCISAGPFTGSFAAYDAAIETVSYFNVFHCRCDRCHAEQPPNLGHGIQRTNPSASRR